MLSAKSLLIFFAPVILPRILGAYRSLRVSITSRPPPRPTPKGASRALNILFVTTFLFLLLSVPINPYAPDRNIFSLTRSRINTPTDVIFSRLARLRPGEVLTEADQLLKEKLTTKIARYIYLTFGSDVLTSCQFCSTESMYTYRLYYLPFHVFLPHLVHMLILGVVTSGSFAGSECSRWRGKFVLGGLVLAALDIYVVTTHDAAGSASTAVKAGQIPPFGFYYFTTILRPVLFAVFDSVCSCIIYLSATNRFFFKPPPATEQLDQAVSAALTVLTGANTKLHAANVTRNAVVRDRALKQRDDVYWQTMVALENPTGGPGGPRGSPGPAQGGVGMVLNNIWEEPEVAQAMSQAMSGNGGVDLAQLGINAQEFVRGVTDGLE